MSIPKYEKTYNNPLDLVSPSTDVVLFCRYPFRLETYEGCTHNCLYCFVQFVKRSRNAPWTSIYPALNIEEVLEEHWKLKKSGEGRLASGVPFRFSAMTDPFQPLEREFKLTYRTLDWLANHPYPFLFVTKSHMVASEPYISLLTKISNQTPVAVSMTIITPDEKIREKFEPGAPSIKKRLNAMKILSENKIRVCSRIQPILPYITDKEEDLEMLVGELHDVGVSHITSECLKIDEIGIWNRMQKRVSEMGFEDKYKDLFGMPNPNKKVGAYWRADDDYRWNVMAILNKLSERNNLDFATCKEGFYELHTTLDCCGANLPGMVFPTAHDLFTLAKNRKRVSLKDLLSSGEVNNPYTGKFIELWKKGVIERRIKGLKAERKKHKIRYTYMDIAS